MKNIKLTLDEKTAAWARVHAAKHNKNISRLVGEMLQHRMRESREYDEAMRRYLAVKPCKFVNLGGRRPTRDELHDRAELRRR